MRKRRAHHNGADNLEKKIADFRNETLPVLKHFDETGLLTVVSFFNFMN